MKLVDVIIQENKLIDDKFLYCNRSKIMTDENLSIKTYIDNYKNPVFIDLYNIFKKINIRYCENNEDKYNKQFKLSCLLYNFKNVNKKIIKSVFYKNIYERWTENNFDYNQNIVEEENYVSENVYNPSNKKDFDLLRTKILEYNFNNVKLTDFEENIIKTFKDS